MCVCARTPPRTPMVCAHRRAAHRNHENVRAHTQTSASISDTHIHGLPPGSRFLPGAEKVHNAQGNSRNDRLSLVMESDHSPCFRRNPMAHEHIRPAHCGRHMRTKPGLAHIATQIVTLRRTGVTIRAIAASVGASRSGIHGLLARLGLGGVRPARSRRPMVLSQRTRQAVALLTHPNARRLTWRQRVALQGWVRGMSAAAIATDLSIRSSSVCSLIATARQRIARPWCRRSRARRQAKVDLADLLAAANKIVQH